MDFHRITATALDPHESSGEPRTDHVLAGPALAAAPPNRIDHLSVRRQLHSSPEALEKEDTLDTFTPTTPRLEK